MHFYIKIWESFAVYRLLMLQLLYYEKICTVIARRATCLVECKFINMSATWHLNDTASFKPRSRPACCKYGMDLSRSRSLFPCLWIGLKPTTRACKRRNICPFNMEIRALIITVMAMGNFRSKDVVLIILRQGSAVLAADELWRWFRFFTPVFYSPPARYGVKSKKKGND